MRPARSPAELVDVVTGYAGRPVRSAFEIGAGTGTATRLLAERGITVTATDPDDAMLAELRRHVGAVRAAFADLRPGRGYELVYAAVGCTGRSRTGGGRAWPRY